MSGKHFLWAAGVALVVLAMLSCNLTSGGAGGAAALTPTFTLPPVEPTTAAPPSQSHTQPPTATLKPSPTQEVVAATASEPTATSALPPTEEDSGLPQVPADVLLSDNFDTASQRWYVYSDDASASGIEGGAYYVSMNTAGRWTWRLGPVDSAVKDVVIQGEARLASADVNGVYGFLCRYDSATMSFYNFALTGDGRYRIARVSNGGDWTMLVDFGGPSPFVKPATAWNQVEVGCVGSTLWLRVNGELLATVQDATFANTGDFGFWAQTRGSSAQARAEYNDLTIRATP